MKHSVMTEALLRASQMLQNTDNKLKEMGNMPYGMVKATPKEQREMFENLTPEQLQELVMKHGYDAVNDYLKRFMGGQNG